MTAHRAQTALAGWLAAFAGYAAVVTAVAQGPESGALRPVADRQ
jgi:hypothetical protein